MTDKFEASMYGFFTKKENYDAMEEVVDYYPKIKNQLLLEFWNELRNEINKWLEEKYGEEFEVQLNDENNQIIKTNKNRLKIYKKNNQSKWLGYIGWENFETEIHYGFRIEDIDDNQKIALREKIWKSR